MSQPRFTVWIPDDVGFTDQLMQLALLYRVGSAAGMAFRLTPPASSRTAPGFWERFDLSRILTTASAAELALPRRPIDLSHQRLLASGVRDGAGLVAVVREQLPPPGTLGELRLQGESRGLLMKIISADPARFECGLDARLQALFAPLAETSGQLPAPGLRLLAHLRCGDAADIALFPGSAYLAWHRVIARTGEVRPNPFLGARILIEALRAHLAPRTLSCAVFSDGYARTRALIDAVEGSADGLTPGEAAVLRAAVDVHQRAAGLLLAGEGIRNAIGEDLDSLCALLWGAQQADLIVITGNQRMLPKFLALLGARAHAPAILLLEADGDQVHFVRAAGLREAHGTLIALSDQGNPLAPLFAYLRHGPRPRDWQAANALAEDAGVGMYCIPELSALAGRLMAAGRSDDAAALGDWLAVLTDAPSGTQPWTPDERLRGQVIAEVSSLLSLGRLRQAALTIHAARERWGEWAALSDCALRLETLEAIAGKETDRAYGPSPPRVSAASDAPRGQAPPAPQSGLMASILRLMGKRRPPQPMAPDAQSSKS